jgi:hypothetical protein
MRQAGVLCEARSPSDNPSVSWTLQWVVDAKWSATRDLCGGVILDITSMLIDSSMHIGLLRADINQRK